MAVRLAPRARIRWLLRVSEYPFRGVVTKVTAAGAALTLALGACAPKREEPPARQILVEGVADERARLIETRDRDPKSIDARVALGEVYYRSAREFLDLERDEERYLIFLSQSVDEFLAAVELDPTDDRPHFYLAMMNVYQGEIDKALRGFRNALKLRPGPIGHTNLAEIFIYMGRLDEARRWNEAGQRMGAPRGAVLFNEMLMAWRAGDLEETRKLFATLRDYHPDAVRTINVARLPHPPREFEGFARYCCRSPACGPYLSDACQGLGIAVEDPELSAEAALKELRIEIEKTRRLREIYRQRKELEIEIEVPPAPEDAEPAGAQEQP